jgi:hypothetical protein
MALKRTGVFITLLPRNYVRKCSSLCIAQDDMEAQKERTEQLRFVELDGVRHHIAELNLESRA